MEGSGGLDEDCIADYMVDGMPINVCKYSQFYPTAISTMAGVDVLSTSSIHQGVKHADFSLKIQ